MKLHLLKIQSFLMIIAIALSMHSCSYTKNTGSSKMFSKKHYNRGIVKHKSSKKDKTTVVLADNQAEEKLSKKEQKAEAKEQIKAYIESEAMTASNKDVPVVETKEGLIAKMQNGFSDAKENLLAQKETASEKESKKIDKKLRRVEKFEGMLGKMAERMSERLTPDPDAAAAPGGRDLMGLLGGIFGITGIVFAFFPYIGFLGLLLCLAAIILGALGLQGDNRGWAIAGIVLGALGFLFFFLALLVIFAILI